ncbi:target of Myb protein 1 isoform X2 [Octopus sinensis]|uniref:Target of Myb protein 1 isoform X2 n=1 Tax=Octopus sinensis TaxID=2607531 RepID=A0A6P7U248_9MOLL|nr:target of Myb protein 1 isoform X2 [Octopus sinensis]
MAALFGHGNPLSTPVGQLIEKASDGSQASENWTLFLDACDIINETDEGPKDAIRAIKKKLQQNAGKNYAAVMYTLILLETCVKNCGKRFHLQVANKEFLHELIKIIGPKNDPPPVVQEKVLSLIQTWADAFHGSAELKEVEKVYQDLKGKGIEFPMTDLDKLAPIHTPARTTPVSEQAPTLSRSRGMSTEAPTNTPPQQQQQQQQQQVPVTMSSGSIIPTNEQLDKLKSELDVVQGNVRVMGEMLTELSPYNVDSSDLELLQELNRTCRQMQQRLVDLLDQVANEEVTSELLRVNDDLNNVFLRYERFERFRAGQTGSQTTDASNTPPVTQDSYLPPSYEQVQASSQSSNVGNLIDLGEDGAQQTGQSDIHTQLAGMSLNSGSISSTLGQISSTTAMNRSSTGTQDTEFDMFAQSRQSFDQSRKNMGNSAYINQQEDQFRGSLGQAVSMKSQVKNGQLSDKEEDLKEMAQWLASDGQATESISSSEFDKFLQERAAAADNLPTISASTAGSTSQPPIVNPRRQLQKDDDDSPLFAL